MRPAIKITLAVSILLVISACTSEATPTATATRATIVPATASATPSAVSSTPVQAAPVVKKRIVTSRRAIPFKTMRVNDPALSKGSTRVRNPGVRGVEVLTYRVTFRNGIQTHKELVRKVIVRAPVTRVVAVGTKETQQCDPNYSGAPAMWPAFLPDANDNDQRLQLDAKWEVIQDFRKDDCAFWRQYYDMGFAAQ